MNTQDGTNGGSSTGTKSLTAAEKLRKRHEADASHHATVEDVVDEEDLAHPPPPSQTLSKPPSNNPTSSPIPSKSEEIHHDKQPEAAEPQALPPKPHAFNTQSEEMFPALGARTKPSTTKQAPTAWGSNKPSSARSAMNGPSSGYANSSLPSSGSSTPISGILTPASSNAPARPSSQGLSFPQKMQIPGKHTERVSFAPQQLLPPKQMRKSMAEIIKETNRTSKARVEMKRRPDGTVVFEAHGPFHATRQALQDLAKQIGSKQETQVPIPMSARPYVIGRQGATIQQIQKQTGARIQVPRIDDGALGNKFEDDDGQIVMVTIEGDALAAQSAASAIEAIIRERSSNVNIRLRDIPPELFPFIAGPHNSNISTLEEGRQIQVHVPHYHTWSERPPPQAPPPDTLPHFPPSTTNHIRISGDRIGAQEARLEIERRAELLKREITLSELQIERGRHQFILDNENSLHDFLAETGCSMIVPPAIADTETITITGPPSNIGLATDKIYDLASAMQMSQIDIARQHQHALAQGAAQAYVHAMTRYFQQRRAVEELEKQFSARIVLPTTGQSSPSWEVYVKEGKNGMRAKQEIMNLIAAHPPKRVRHIEIDPFYHQYIHQRGFQVLQDQFGVHLLAPISTNPPSYLTCVYEGPQGTSRDPQQLPKRPPSTTELAEFEQSLSLAQQHILDLIAGQETLRSTTIESPTKYHDKVQRFLRREQQNLPVEQAPVQLHFEPLPHANGDLQAVSHPAGLQKGILRGTGNAVDDLAVKIAAFVEAEKRDELERHLVTSFEFPQKHMNQLIGRRGENINKLRDEFDVNIRTHDGQIDLIGPKAKAEAAKSRIIALGRQLQDESTHILDIPPQYHRDIIGSKGSQVNHLQDRYNVRIQFPRSVVGSRDDKSLADDASEVSARKNRKPDQKPNEVIVKGPSRGADAARDELLSLLRWTIDHSNTASVSVAQKQLPSLMGSGGQEMESLRLATGASIDVPNKDSVDTDGRVLIRLRGTKKQVEDARKTLAQKAQAFDNTITRSIELDRKHHKSLIGPGGSTIRDIVIAAGGSEDRRDVAKTVRFPRLGSEESTIHVEGSKDVVDKIVASLVGFANQRDNNIMETLDIPVEKHRLLIGHGGTTKKGLESRFKIDLAIPRLSDEGPARTEVKVAGLPEDVQKAKAHIVELTRDNPGETVIVPRKFHHTIADNGRLFGRLRNSHNVTVDHGNQRPPQKISHSTPSTNDSNSSMPLITDDPSTSNAHSFTIVDNATVSTEAGTIPWNLKGKPEDVAKARTTIEKALEAAESQPSQVTGYLTVADPRSHRFIIGPGGSKINEIRKKSGCRINVPNNGMDSSAIEIVGSNEGVVKARDLILEAIGRGERRE